MELAILNDEKEKRAVELFLANVELAFQNKEKEHRASELAIANIELAFQNSEKEKRSNELADAYADLKKTGEHLKEYITGLEDMMFMTSHKVRQPIANILGLSNIIEQSINSPAELTKLLGCIRESAQRLDVFTKELTKFMTDLKQTGKA